MKNQIKNFNFTDNVTIKFNESPKHPSHILTDNYYGGTLTKAEFWKDDVTGMDNTPDGGELNGDGTWTFWWMEGEIMGFVEGEDFEFVEGN